MTIRSAHYLPVGTSLIFEPKALQCFIYGKWHFDALIQVSLKDVLMIQTMSSQYV